MNHITDITIVIATYNSENLILNNLETLKKFQTVIHDNSNSDQLYDIVKNFKNINLIKSKINIGFGKAINVAVKKVKTEFILIANPDLILDELSIKKLFKEYHNADKNIGVIAPSLLDTSNKRRTNGTISYIKKINGLNVNLQNNNLPVYNMCCEYLVGCCYLLKKSLFDKVEGFDENFFMYFEDNDFCDKIIRSGKYLLETPSSTFVHIENSSYKKNLVISIKLSIIQKISSYVYLEKNINFFYLYYIIFINTFDYFQRFIKNLFFLNFKKSFKNLLRLISIFLFVFKLYKIKI